MQNLPLSSAAQRTIELINIASVSLHEERITQYIRSVVPDYFRCVYDDDSVLFYVPNARNQASSVTSGTKPLVMLCGHTDTVPFANSAVDNSAVVTADLITGRGSADMKSGLALMLEIAELVAQSPHESELDLALCFFGREELSADFNPLPTALNAFLHDYAIELAILHEPTNGHVEPGCQGNINLSVNYTGTAGHSARPWLCNNAITTAIDSLRSLPALLNSTVNEVVIDGLTFKEVASVTSINGGVAANVIPSVAQVGINVRYAPNRDPQSVEQQWLSDLSAPNATPRIVGHAKPAAVVVKQPLVEKLIECGDNARLEVTPKLGWTNAADFSALDIPAVNFGPGDPQFAHTDNESVRICQIDECVRVMCRFLGLNLPGANEAHQHANVSE